MGITSDARRCARVVAALILASGCGGRISSEASLAGEDGASNTPNDSTGNVTVQVPDFFPDGPDGPTPVDASEASVRGSSGSDGSALWGDSGALDQTDTGAAASADSDRKLTDIRLDIGAMAFNEVANVGFSWRVAVQWVSKNVIVSSSGHFGATVVTTYSGPLEIAEQVRDVLFWQATADYTAGSFGDTMTVPLSNATGVVGSSSNGLHIFVVDGPFGAPPLVDAQGNSLIDVNVNFTWVRVYRTDGSLTFSVFPGAGASNSDGGWGLPIPLAWNQTQPAGGNLAYYTPIAGGQSTNVRYGGFDYQGWVAANVSW